MEKKWLLFGGGVLTGVVLTVLVLFVIGHAMNNNGGLSGATFFDKPGQVIHDRSFKVLQVIQDDAALVNAKSDGYSDLYFGPVYLLINHNGIYYYDDQKIKVPSSQVVRQVGIYKYTAGSGFQKTVPIIEVK